MPDSFSVWGSRWDSRRSSRHRHKVRPVLPLAKLLSNGIVSPNSFTLLQQGSCADSQAFAELLGRPPLAAEQFAEYK